MVDAYLLEEELCYYGIVFHESVEESIREAMSNGKHYYPIEDIKIPFKNGKSKHYHIAWYKLDAALREGDISLSAIEWLKDMRKTVSGNPRVYLDNTIDIINLPKPTES